MNCEQIKPEIQAFCDGELHGSTRGQIRRHIDACDACRSEFAALRRLSAEIRSADYVTDVTVANKEPRKHRLVKLVRLPLAICIVAVLSALWLHLPQRSAKSDPNAAVAAALNGVQTWHLSGWKQINNQHVPWDIWGRRYPYLRYEKLGQDVTIDDGTTKRLILAPDSALGRPTGLVIETSDQSSTDAQTKIQQAFIGLMEPDVDTMIDGWDWLNGGGMYARKPFKQSKDELAFRREWSTGMGAINDYHVYTISKRSWLPIRYEFDNRSDKGEWDTELLTAHYGVDLPDDVVHSTVAAPAGYSTIDFTGSRAALIKKNNHTYVVGPFQITGNATAMDAQGNVIVQFSTLMAGKPLEDRSSSIFAVSIGFNDLPYLHGDIGNRQERYLYVDRLYPPDVNGVTPIFLTPLDELTAQSQLPQSIVVEPTVTITITCRSSDVLDASGRSYPQNAGATIVESHIPMTVDVSRANMVKDITIGMPADWKKSVQHGLNQMVYQERATWHYMPTATDVVFTSRYRDELRGFPITANGGIDLQATGNKPINLTLLTAVWKKYANERAEIRKSEMRQAVYWEQRRLDEVDQLAPSDRLDVTADCYRMMAFYYRDAGEKQAMNKVLNDQLAIIERTEPSKSLDARQIQYEIKTGKLPSDPDFAGPS